MTIALVVIAALMALAAVAIPARGRGAALAYAAVLALGLAAYFHFGSPGLQGSAAASARVEPQIGERIDRPLLGTATGFDTSTQWLMFSQSFARRGDTLSAVKAVEAGLKQHPRSANLWVGLGAALMEHGGGLESTASREAFARAETIDPGHAGPDLYRGIAAVREGDGERAAAIWQGLLDRTEGDAEWRQELRLRLGLLNRLLAIETVEREPAEAQEAPER